MLPGKNFHQIDQLTLQESKMGESLTGLKALTIKQFSLTLYLYFSLPIAWCAEVYKRFVFISIFYGSGENLLNGFVYFIASR